jgi:phosphate starvation-inducible PhoH-like protein|tara:strand:- start:1795 stop:2796 length:1002 start_codon:yes stop_codon:yes gene_type:complete
LKQLSAQPASSLALQPIDARRLATLCGQLDENIKLIAKRLDLDIRCRNHVFYFYGAAAASQAAYRAIDQLYQQTAQCDVMSLSDVHLQLRQQAMEQPMIERVTATAANSDVEKFSVIRTKKGNIKPRGINQQNYVRAMQGHDINFGVGPAGTGKTYLAVACAVESLLRDEVERILLVRPAVEAGERLGFLPGDLAQKVDPYLRPLYDALHEMLGFETVAKLQERNIIEIAPLAYMRGRTLNGAYIILDESQNTTREQMKMFLTRIGFGSTAVITGDMSQIDLPRGTASGLTHACEVLAGVEAISFTHFQSRDVVRHPIVQSIVDAYDAHESDL